VINLKNVFPYVLTLEKHVSDDRYNASIQTQEGLESIGMKPGEIVAPIWIVNNHGLYYQFYPGRDKTRLNGQSGSGDPRSIGIENNRMYPRDITIKDIVQATDSFRRAIKCDKRTWPDANAVAIVYHEYECQFSCIVQFLEIAPKKLHEKPFPVMSKDRYHSLKQSRQ